MRKTILAGMGVGVVILGVVAYASTTNILGVGTMSYSELINGPAEVTARQFISQPGEMGGWHFHPGPVISVVTSGTLTVEDGCGGNKRSRQDRLSNNWEAVSIDGRISAQCRRSSTTCLSSRKAVRSRSNFRIAAVVHREATVNAGRRLDDVQSPDDFRESG